MLCHPLCRHTPPLQLELENNLKEERRKAVKETQQKIDHKRDGLEKHLQELRKECADLEVHSWPHARQPIALALLVAGY